MMRRLGFCAIILLCALQAMALDAVVAHTVFYNQAGHSPAVELHWQINPNTLHYNTTAEKTIVARIKTDILFISESGGIIKEDHYVLQTVPRASVDELAQFSITELRRYDLPPGTIKLKFVLTDLADNINHFNYSDSFTITAAPESAPFYSDIQLLDTLFESTAQTAFSKNGRQQIPSCANFINDGANTLRYYAELYETGRIPATDYPLVQKVSISKSATEGYYSDMQHKDTVTVAQKMSLISGSFNIASLPSGNYYVRVTLENNAKQTITSNSYFFQRMNRHPTMPEVKKKEPVSDTSMESVTVLNLSKTFLAKYDMAQVRAILKMLLPFSDQQGTSTINNFLKKPDEMYMRYYIYNFFTAINKDDPGRAWKEFTNKITAVNKRFNTHGTPGYETERGFLYLRYGAPTEVVTVENEQGALPYEVWQYNVLTQLNHKDIPNAVFLFYKQNQMSDHRLLHSTVTGEIQNAGWRNQLYTNQQGGRNTNSRAEQYLGDR